MFGPSMRVTKTMLEHGRHGCHGLHLGFDLIEQVALQHTCVYGCVVTVVLVDVPAAIDKVGDVGERDQLFDQRIAIFGAFAEPDVTDLGERADGLRLTLLGPPPRRR